MDHILNTYGSLIVPAVVALVLIFAVMKVVSAIFKLVMLAVLAFVLFGGFAAYSRLAAIEKAANAVTLSSGGGYMQQAAIAAQVGAQARQVLAQSGLNPQDLHLRVNCAGSNTSVQVWYSDDQFLFGLLSQQRFDVPLQGNVRC